MSLGSNRDSPEDGGDFGGGTDNTRADLTGIELSERDNPDTGLNCRHADHWSGNPMSADLQLAFAEDIRRIQGLPSAMGQDRPPARAALERMPGPDPIRDVVVGPRWLDDRDRKRVAAVGNREVGGGANLFGEAAQRRHRRVTQEGLNTLRELEQAEAEPGPAVPIASHETVLLKGGEQPVDHAPVHPETARHLGDCQATWHVGQQAEEAKPPVQGL